MKEVFTMPKADSFRYLVMRGGETLTSQILLPNELAIEGVKKAQGVLEDASRVDEAEAVPLTLKGKRLALWRGVKDGSPLVGSLREPLVSIGALPKLPFIVAACLQQQVSDHRDAIREEKGDVYGGGSEAVSLARAASHQFDPFNTEEIQTDWSEEEWEKWDEGLPLGNKAAALAEELFAKRPLFFVSFAPEMAPGSHEEMQLALDFMPYIASAMMQESRTITSPTEFTANVPKGAVKSRPDYD